MSARGPADYPTTHARIICLDVHYEERATNSACVGFSNWKDADAAFEFVERLESAPEPYQPGQFYKRELPHLLRAIERAERTAKVEIVVVDGYVWLSEGKPGLGAHLYLALSQRIAVVGVAKTEFRGNAAIAVLRGQSQQALFVTATGIDPSQAAESIRDMHGAYRVPTLLKRVDQLSRQKP
jgi:deoxyribonuclease V